MFSLPAIRSVLECARQREPAEGSLADAAVAMMFCGLPDALELCLIRRTTREGDPWSGQLAFPGGRADADDRNMRETAEREVTEEVGLDLSRVEYLGPLSCQPIQPNRTGKPSQLWPFAYYLGAQRPTLHPDPREVERAFWAPLSVLGEREHRTELPWAGLSFPGIRIGEDVLWGLTLRVCERFCEQIGTSLDLDWPFRP